MVLGFNDCRIQRNGEEGAYKGAVDANRPSLPDRDGGGNMKRIVSIVLIIAMAAMLFAGGGDSSYEVQREINKDNNRSTLQIQTRRL